MTRFLNRSGVFENSVLPLHKVIPLIIGCFVSILSLILISCSDKAIDHDKFIDAYIDLHIAEDTLKQVSGDVQKIKERILAKHGMTWKEYNETFRYFNENPELWDAFYAKVIARVDTLKKMKQK